jgi:hypothetical protein
LSAIQKAGKLDDKIISKLEKSLYEEMSPFWGCMAVAEKLIRKGYKYFFFV